MHIRKWYIFIYQIGVFTTRHFIRKQRQIAEEEYIEVCACSVDLCNSYVSSSGVASTLQPYPALTPSLSTSYKNTPIGPSSSFSYSSSTSPTQFNFVFELVNTSVM